MKITTNFIKQTKRHLCASGSILLPLAQKWGLVGLVAMVMLSAFGTQSVSAASITLTVPKEPLTFSITPSSGGAFGKSKAGTIKIQTDALAGYTLNIEAKDGKADLTNEATGDKISPISGIVSENDFMSKAIYNNMWGFSFNKQGASNNTFHPIPGDAVGTKIGSTEVPNTAEDIYNIVLGARVDNSLATGAYSNTFIVVASANPVPYKVKYESNAGSDPVNGMPNNSTSATTSTQSFALPAEEPTRAGYRFIGWCDTTPNKESGTVDVCQSGKSYQASDTYTLEARDEDITFYAMWASNDHIMQNWKGCATATKNEQITLVDIRDNRPYYVAKLDDENCWMTENLDLFIDKNTTYTVEDTDLAYATEEEKNACKESEPSCVEGDNYVWKPSESTHETKDGVWNSTFEEGAPGEIHPQSYDPSDTCWTNERTWVSWTNHSGTDLKPCSEHDSTHFHIGNYYNYSAAVAQNDTSKYTAKYKAYNTSLCPAVWQLPANDGDKSFINLMQKANTAGHTWTAGYIGQKTENQTTDNVSTMQNAPFYFTYSGVWQGGFIYVGYGGFYRSNAVSSGTRSFYLLFGGEGSLLTQNDTGHRYHGFPVRCISRTN